MKQEKSNERVTERQYLLALSDKLGLLHFKRAHLLLAFFEFILDRSSLDVGFVILVVAPLNANELQMIESHTRFPFCPVELDDTVVFNLFSVHFPRQKDQDTRVAAR